MDTLFFSLQLQQSCSNCFKMVLSGCEELGIIPGSVRTDKGEENVQVFRFMMLVHNEDPSCFKASSSCHNQPIELE